MCQFKRLSLTYASGVKLNPYAKLAFTAVDSLYRVFVLRFFKGQCMLTIKQRLIDLREAGGVLCCSCRAGRSAGFFPFLNFESPGTGEEGSL